MIIIDITFVIDKNTILIVENLEVLKKYDRPNIHYYPDISLFWNITFCIWILAAGSGVQLEAISKLFGIFQNILKYYFLQQEVVPK